MRGAVLVYNERMKERGGATTGIIIILLILIVGGFFLYKNVKQHTDLIKAEQARNQDSAQLNLDANVSGSLNQQ